MHLKINKKQSKIILGTILVLLSPMTIAGSIFKCKETNNQGEVVTVFSQTPCANDAQETASEGLGTSKGGKFSPQKNIQAHTRIWSDDNAGAAPKPKQEKATGSGKKGGYKRAIESARKASSQASPPQ